MPKRKKNHIKKKSTGGRPALTLDWVQFDKLCAIHCTLTEIADHFDMSEDSIENIVKREKNLTFSDYFKSKAAGGKKSLRRAMFHKALNQGNTTMMIWLSKQHLGMTDKQDMVVNEADLSFVEDEENT